MQTASPNIEKEQLMRIAKGETAAFDQLMDNYYGMCYQTAFLLLRNHEQAKDLVQEVFIKVWIRRSKLQEVENFGGWLRTITTHLIYDYLTKRRQQIEKHSEWVQAVNLPVQSEASDEEVDLERLVEEALARLPSKQRETFILIKKKGYSRQKAASVMQVSGETIKTNLERAMRSIRAYCLGKIHFVSAITACTIIF